MRFDTKFLAFATLCIGLFASVVVAAPVEVNARHAERASSKYSQISQLMQNGTPKIESLGGVIASIEKGLAAISYDDIVGSGLETPLGELVFALAGYEKQANSIYSLYNGGKCTPGQDIKSIFGEFSTAAENAFAPAVAASKVVPGVGDLINDGYQALRGFTAGLSANFCDF